MLGVHEAYYAQDTSGRNFRALFAVKTPRAAETKLDEFLGAARQVTVVRVVKLMC